MKSFITVMLCLLLVQQDLYAQEDTVKSVANYKKAELDVLNLSKQKRQMDNGLSHFLEANAAG
jgi:hypothetical protein